MRITDAFPSNYIKGDDFVGRTEQLTIARVVMEKMPEGDSKAVVYFTGRTKGWVLNVTNARTLSQAFGVDTENWHGRTVELYGTPVEYKGESRNGIRVRLGRPPMPEPQQAAPAAAPAAAGAPFNDEIPNW